MTTEAQREKWAAARKAQRAKATEDEKEFHMVNRAYLQKKSPTEYERLLNLQEEAKNEIWWMLRGHLRDVSDPSYLSLADGLQSLDAFVQQNGLLHTGYIPCEVSNGGIKTDLSINGRGVFYWAEGERYWQHTRLFTFLCGLSKPTEYFAKYGLICGIPDWRWTQYRKDVTNKAGQLDETLWRNLPVLDLQKYMGKDDASGDVDKNDGGEDVTRKF